MSFSFNFDVPETAGSDCLDGNEILNLEKDTFASQNVSYKELFNVLVLGVDRHRSSQI